jgi:MULE transposase domain
MSSHSILPTILIATTCHWLHLLVAIIIGIQFFFGMALLRAEKVTNFVWLFETWLKIMYGKYPKSIITYQDPAMRIVIKKIFPNTIHRCCQWHVMRKAREQLLKVYSSKSNFEDHLKKVINRSLTITNFEQGWAAMLEAHKVKDNNHLKVIFHS